MHNVVCKSCFTKDILGNPIFLYSAVGDLTCFHLILQGQSESTKIKTYASYRTLDIFPFVISEIEIAFQVVLGAELELCIDFSLFF